MLEDYLFILIHSSNIGNRGIDLHTIPVVWSVHFDPWLNEPCRDRLKYLWMNEYQIKPERPYHYYDFYVDLLFIFFLS